MKIKKILIICLIIAILVGAFYLLINSSDNNKNNLIKLSYDEIINKIDNKESFVLVISRTNCSHCANYKPKLKEVAGKYNIKIYYIDTDELDKETLTKFTQKMSFDGSTPTTLFIKDGEEKTTATRIEGDVSEERLIEKLKKNGFIK